MNIELEEYKIKLSKAQMSLYSWKIVANKWRNAYHNNSSLQFREANDLHFKLMEHENDTTRTPEKTDSQPRS